MKIFILITAIIELLAGVIMFLMPRQIPAFKNADARSATLASMYGAAAIGIGFYALQAWNYYADAEMVHSFLLTFIIFHAGVMAAAFRGSRSGLKDMTGVAILHGILMLATLFFYVQMR